MFPPYGIPWMNDLMASVALLLTWLLLGGPRGIRRAPAAYWCVMGNVVIAGAASVPMLARALSLGDAGIAAYHLMWVLAGIAAALHCMSTREIRRQARQQRKALRSPTSTKGVEPWS